MNKIQNYASHSDLLSYPSSITTFITQLNNAMEKKNIITSYPDKIDNLWFITGVNEYLYAMVADDDRSTIVQMRARDMTSSAIDNDIEGLEDFINSIPDTVKSIELSSLSPLEQEKYLPYIADDIISSWQANNMEIEE